MKKRVFIEDDKEIFNNVIIGLSSKGDLTLFFNYLMLILSLCDYIFELQNYNKQQHEQYYHK